MHAIVCSHAHEHACKYFYFICMLMAIDGTLPLSSFGHIKIFTITEEHALLISDTLSK